jgi:hypothetical protein
MTVDVSQIIEAGKNMELVLVIIAAAATIYFLYVALQGRPEAMRTMPQLEAVEDGVDRAVEEGKPVIVTVGYYSYLSGLYAPMSIAGINLQRYTARLCVRKGARVILPVPVNPEMLPLIDGIFREVCVAEGKPEAYRREDVKYYGKELNDYALGLVGTIAENGVSLFIEMGAVGGSSAGPGGFAREYGAIVMGGTPRYYHLGSWTVLADYPIIADDVLAVGALASGDPVVQSSIVGGDVIKLILLAITWIGAVLALSGVPIVDWLKM